MTEWKRLPEEGLPHQFGPILVANNNEMWVAECFHHYRGPITYDPIGIEGYDWYTEYNPPTHWRELPEFPTEVSE